MNREDSVVCLASTLQQGASIAHSREWKPDFCRRLKRCRGAIRQNDKALADQTGINVTELEGCESYKNCHHRKIDERYGPPDTPKQRHLIPL